MTVSSVTSAGRTSGGANLRVADLSGANLGGADLSIRDAADALQEEIATLQVLIQNFKATRIGPPC
jgi:uncharacterized protein YjbI with pentapeptide repeats